MAITIREQVTIRESAAIAMTIEQSVQSFQCRFLPEHASTRLEGHGGFGSLDGHAVLGALILPATIQFYRPTL
ncbi:hypothetical protein G3578_09720 [Brevibacillus sp. SYP-B805]|uniref:hypothetical protein n=1 Tax=Brevibacillus sp. SYP-B805 TaxID=1578199 RepID=UPI0013ED0677|nr:hypothetical protein [Brevibacillus sp. SYP-B805]NGQ95432.1 hypothetical protein [Brevibacillus sp. SYP-B805]